MSSIKNAKALTISGHELKPGEQYEILLHVRDKNEVAKKVKVSQKRLDLELGETATLQASLLPEGGVTDTKIFWASKDPSVAQVDRNGKVTAVSKGKTTIYAYSTNLKSAKVTVKVKD